MHLDRPAELAQAPAQGAADAAEQGDGGIQFGAPVQAQPLRLAEVQVDHLAAGVHAGVGAAGDRDPDGAADQQREGLLQDALDGAQARLHGPPAERAAVVRHIQPDTQKPAAPQDGGSGFELVHRLKSIRKI